MAASKQQTILFLCTGNYYRSRFAEIYFNAIARKMGLPWAASSRGLALERGINNIGPIAQATVTALEALGIRDPEQCRRMPAQVSDADLATANRIIALKQDEHLPLFTERFPAWTEKVEFWHVDDCPKALSHIEQHVMNLIAQLCGGGGEAPPQPVEPTPKSAQKPRTARVGRETKGRRGKGVTTVFDLALDEAELKELAAILKQRCGTGGTAKDGRIEIQGDQRERIVAELVKLGYKVTRTGG